MKFSTCKKAAAALLLALALPLAACGSDDGDPGSGDGWLLAEDGTLTVNSTGSTPVVETDAYDKSPWFEVKTQIKRVMIKDTVTEIGETAFAQCPYLETVTLPKSVSVLGRECFADNNRLRRIALPEGVKEIGTGAFSCCRGLEEVEIAGTDVVIGDIAFISCDSVESVTVSGSIKSLGRSALAFGRAESLSLPEGLKTVGDTAFAGCVSLKELSLPASLEEVGADAFPQSLETLNFAGSAARWESLGVTVPKGCRVVCADGALGGETSDGDSLEQSAD